MPLPTEQELRDMQRSLTDYFHFWRIGKGYQYDRIERQSAIRKIEFPRKGKWPGFEREKVAHKATRINKIWEDKGPGFTRFQATQATEKIRPRMDAVEMRFVKILGWGGLGVASLWEAVGPTGRKRRVVCKMDLYDNHPCVESEIQMHLKTAGAKHVVQRMVLQDQRKQVWAARSRRRSSRHTGSRRPSVKAEPESSRATRDAADDEDDFMELDKDDIAQEMKQAFQEELDADKKVLFIEYMPRGRFDDYIGKVAIARERFPDLVLWHIFDCLFRAVIGMAYPEAFQPVGSDPKTHNLPPISESCTGFPPLTSHCHRETIVHFDIDPLNVLVGDFDEGEHNMVPILKIADLGLATIFDGASRSTTKNVWDRRSWGKKHIYTPEQFSEEWDYVNSTPQAARCSTAGNYNWWTNLYQVALIMWTLITLHEVEYPPVIEELDLTRPDGTVTKEWTYGGYVLHERFAATSPELRNLVALCLVSDPTRRPDMFTLQETIQRHTLKKGPVTEEERKVQEWVGRVFGGAPPPVPPPPQGAGKRGGEAREGGDDGSGRGRGGDNDGRESGGGGGDGRGKGGADGDGSGTVAGGGDGCGKEEGGGGGDGQEGSGKNSSKGKGKEPGRMEADLEEEPRERIQLKGPGEDLGVAAKRRLEMTAEDEARLRLVNRTANIRRAPKAMVNHWAKGLAKGFFG